MKIELKYLAEVNASGKKIEFNPEIRNAIKNASDKKANLSQWVNDLFQDLGLKDGWVNLELDEKKNEVYTIVTYNADEQLSKKQMELLVNETTNQLTDGYGENNWVFEVLEDKIEVILLDLNASKIPALITVTKEKPVTKKKRRSPIFSLIEKGEILKAEKYLDKNHLSSIDKWNMTPLMIAIREGYTDLSLKIIKAGANVNHESESSSPLTMAATNGDVIIGKELIKNGAQVNFNKPDLETNKSYSPLMIAANRGHIEFLKLLIENEADVNLQSTNGQTALHLAQDANIVNLLLENNANPNLKDNTRKTPLEDAKYQLESWENRSLFNNKEMVSKYKAVIKALERNNGKGNKFFKIFKF